MDDDGGERRELECERREMERGDAARNRHEPQRDV